MDFRAGSGSRGRRLVLIIRGIEGGNGVIMVIADERRGQAGEGGVEDVDGIGSR